MHEHYPVCVIGAGQSGLSMSYCLKEAGIRHIVLEESIMGSAWRHARWDSFCLVTPNWQCQLPGHPYDGDDPQGFMVKDEIIDYLERYRARFEPPIRENTKVFGVRRAIGREPNGEFELSTSKGSVFADQVVVAAGSYHTPRIPDYARALPSHVVQIHSEEYRNAESLPPGEILVVGTGQSGCQIAEDLHLRGRVVHLCVGRAPRCARRYRGRDVVEWLDLMGHYDMAYEDHPDKADVRDKTNHYVTGRDGGHDLDLRQFALEGMRLYGPLSDVKDGQLCFIPELAANLDSADATYRRINRGIDTYIEQHGLAAPPGHEYVPPWAPDAETPSLDLASANISTVVWSIGFRTDFNWVEFPIFDEQGLPLHARGVTPVRGLYFLGLPWQHTWGSARFSGVGRDARHLLRHIQRTMRLAESLSNEAWRPVALELK